MKTFSNSKDCLNYLKTKAKEGEEVCLDEGKKDTNKEERLEIIVGLLGIVGAVISLIFAFCFIGVL